VRRLGVSSLGRWLSVTPAPNRLTGDRRQGGRSRGRSERPPLAGRRRGQQAGPRSPPTPRDPSVGPRPMPRKAAGVRRLDGIALARGRLPDRAGGGLPGAHAREAEAPDGSGLHHHRPHRDGRQPPAPAWPVGAGAGRLVQALGGLTRVAVGRGMGRRSSPGGRSNWGGGGILSSHSLLHASRAIAPLSCPKRSTRTGPPCCWISRVTASNTT
jgi:hypothetical protein